MDLLKWTVQEKEINLKKMLFVSNEVSKCSGCCCGINSCASCVRGAYGFERHYNPSLFTRVVC